MFIISALSVFFLTILLEILVVLDFYATAALKPIWSALYTGLATLVGGTIILIYVHSNWMLAVDTVGAAVGAYISVKYIPRLKLFQARSSPDDTESAC